MSNKNEDKERVGIREVLSFIYNTDKGTKAFILGLYGGLIFSLILTFLITLNQMIRLL